MWGIWCLTSSHTKKPAGDCPIFTLKFLASTNCEINICYRLLIQHEKNLTNIQFAHLQYVVGFLNRRNDTDRYTFNMLLIRKTRQSCTEIKLWPYLRKIFKSSRTLGNSQTIPWTLRCSNFYVNPDLCCNRSVTGKMPKQQKQCHGDVYFKVGGMQT